LEFGSHFVAGRVLHEGRVGGQKSRIDVIRAMATVQVGATEIGVVLWSLERFGNGRLWKALAMGVLAN
jgi:hypothetical protein